MLRVADDTPRSSMSADNARPIPTHIRVGPYRYRVMVTTTALSDDHDGQTNFRDLTMTVRPAMAHDGTVDTLLHEILHALWHVGVANDHGKKVKEETVIERLTPHLLAVLRDNPDLVAYLCDTTDLPVAT